MNSSPVKIKYFHIKNCVCVLIITASIISFISNGLMKGYKIPYDFNIFYASGQIWMEGGNNYDPNLLCSRTHSFPDCYDQYLPIGNAFFSLFSYFPIEESANLFRIINLVLLFGIIIILGYFLMQYRKLGWIEFALLASFINTGFSRQNIKGAQLGIIICTFLFSTFYLIQKGKVYLSSLGLAGTLIKPNFFPILIIYSVIRRKWKILFIGLFISLLLLLLPCFLTGRPIISTHIEWIVSIINNHGIESNNNPSPYDTLSAQLVYLLPLINRIFNFQSEIITLVTYLILIGVWTFSLLRLASLKYQGDNGLFEFGLISALTLLSIFHRQYDTFLLFPGVIVIYQNAINQVNIKHKIFWFGYLLVIMILLTVPGDLTTNLTDKYLILKESHFWRVLAPLQVWAGVLVVFGLLWLLIHKTIPAVIGRADEGAGRPVKKVTTAQRKPVRLLSVKGNFSIEHFSRLGVRAALSRTTLLDTTSTARENASKDCYF